MPPTFATRSGTTPTRASVISPAASPATPSSSIQVAWAPGSARELGDRTSAARLHDPFDPDAVEVRRGLLERLP